MREILIDWLVQVHLKFKLLHETLYLTVAILDRFIQVSSIPDVVGHGCQVCAGLF